MDRTRHVHSTKLRLAAVLRVWYVLVAGSNVLVAANDTAASRLLDAINTSSESFDIAGTEGLGLRILSDRPHHLHVDNPHIANQPVMFAGYATGNTSLATVASNTTFTIQPDVPNGNALMDFGNQNNIIAVNPGGTLVFRGVALQGLPPNFIEPPAGQPALKNVGLFTWPSVVIQPGATVRVFGWDEGWPPLHM